MTEGGERERALRPKGRYAYFVGKVPGPRDRAGGGTGLARSPSTFLGGKHRTPGQEEFQTANCPHLGQDLSLLPPYEHSIRPGRKTLPALGRPSLGHSRPGIKSTGTGSLDYPGG